MKGKIAEAAQRRAGWGGRWLRKATARESWRWKEGRWQGKRSTSCNLGQTAWSQRQLNARLSPEPSSALLSPPQV